MSNPHMKPKTKTTTENGFIVHSILPFNTIPTATYFLSQKKLYPVTVVTNVVAGVPCPSLMKPLWYIYTERIK